MLHCHFSNGEEAFEWPKAVDFDSCRPHNDICLGWPPKGDVCFHLLSLKSLGYWRRHLKKLPTKYQYSYYNVCYIQSYNLLQLHKLGQYFASSKVSYITLVSLIFVLHHRGVSEETTLIFILFKYKNYMKK